MIDLPSSPATHQIKGMTLVTWSANGYRSPKTFIEVRKLPDIGITHLSLIITAYQDNQYASEVRKDDNRTPTLAAVRQCLNWAAGEGLYLTIKPHVNCDNQSWSGMIDPDDPSAWFESYWSFLLPLAMVAETTQATLFIIGTELGSTLQYTHLWQETIRKVRENYSGAITYAASWDEASRVPFWNDLDVIGINFYAPVSNRKQTSRAEILSNWQPWLNRLETLHRQTGKPILFTEIGYRSMDGAGMNPHDFHTYSEIDLSEQADLYWAALQATTGIDWFRGMFWWNWLASGEGGSANSDFTPSGKPAQEELHRAWGQP